MRRKNKMQMKYENYVKDLDNSGYIDYGSFKEVKSIWGKDCIIFSKNRRKFAICFRDNSVHIYRFEKQGEKK
jgi:hypothetical protein